MEEFMEHEEEFEARQSVSSRGRDTRNQMMPGEARPTNQKELNRPTNNNLQAYQPSAQEYAHGFGDVEGDGDESSVITEIVSEKVIEIDSDNEISGSKNQLNDNMHHYLNDIKQEEYVNREEYNEEYDQRQEEDSPYDQRQRMLQRQMEIEEQEQQDLKAQQYMYNQSSPIQENPNEEELTTSPQYYEAPRAINPKYRKKYEGTDLNDKSHLIWEQERLERKRIEKRMQQANIWAKPYSSRDIEWNLTTNPKKAFYDTQKDIKRSNMWHFAHSSSVPMLTPSSKVASQMKITQGVVGSKGVRQKFDPNENTARRKHDVNNAFLQSSYQNLLQGDKTQKLKVPSLYTSLQKESGRAFMSAIDNRYDFQTSVLEGRAKNFYSSQIF